MSKSILNGLTILEKQIISDKKVIYICKCREVSCSNPIKIRPSNRHNGYCRSCADKQKRNKPYETLFNYFKKSQGDKVFLDYAEFVQLCAIKECHYCDAPTIRSEFKNANWSNAYMIDRKDNLLPYTINNCVSCCWYCNNLKSNRFTHDEFLKLRYFIKKEFGR